MANNVENGQKREMRAPGLVARLMGLDSMPTLQRDKSKKVSPSSSFVSRKAEKLVDKREEPNVESVGVKHEVRPQKLQRTSVCEREPVARFGAEKLPFKNVLSKSRKNHHLKLPSPAKSPKIVSRKKPSKLIGAATRILEPGLQTSRSKCALTYSNASRSSPQEPDLGGRTHSLSSHLEGSYGFGSVAAEGDSSCMNCGYMLDNLNGRPSIASQPLVFASPFSNNASSCCHVSQQTTFYHQLEEEARDGYSKPMIGNAQSHVKLASYRSPFCAGHIQQQQLCETKRGLPLPLSTNLRPYRQNQMLRARETVPSRPNVSTSTNAKALTTVVNDGTKNSVSANQNMSYSSRLRVPSRIESSRFELEKRVPNSSDDSVPTCRKRRPSNTSRQGEHTGCSSFTINKPIMGSPPVAGKKLGYNPHFTFNSSVIGADEAVVRSGSYCDEGGEEESGRKTKFEMPCPISGDALGALLEQKLKELNCQGEDTGNAPKKTTATILQELITALTSEVPFQQDNLPDMSDRRHGWSDRSRLSNSKPSTVVQASQKSILFVSN